MAVTVQEAQVVFSAEGMGKVASEAEKARASLLMASGAATHYGEALQSAMTGLPVGAMRRAAQLGVGAVTAEGVKARGAIGGLVGVAAKAGSALRSAFSGIGAQLGALGVAAGAAKIFQLSANAEQTAISLEVLTGSAQSAKQMLTEIRALDMKTVFGTKDLADNAKLMMQQGMGAEQAMKTLTGLTEIAAGDAEALSRLSLAMAPVSYTHLTLPTKRIV